MSFSRMFDIAGSGMSAHMTYLNTTASNLANAHSVSGTEDKAYRARKPVFSAELESQINGMGMNGFRGNTEGVGVTVQGIVESPEPLLKRYDPNHPKANAEGYIYESNVNTVQEMTDMITGSKGFEICAEFLNTQKDLAAKTIEKM